MAERVPGQVAYFAMNPANELVQNHTRKAVWRGV
jgi:hypothetical protein